MSKVTPAPSPPSSPSSDSPSSNVGEVKSKYVKVLKLLLILTLAYNDEASDFKMLFEFHALNKMHFFRITLAFLIIPTTAHLVMVIIQNRKIGLTATLLGCLTATLQLNPLICAIEVWRGSNNNRRVEGAAFEPFNMFMISRIIEVVLEALPEAILQLYFLFTSKGNLSKVAIYSIASSVASSAYTMSDSNVMKERAFMKRQLKGLSTHPYIGFLPDEPLHQSFVLLGLFLFMAGYLSCGLMATTAAASVWSGTSVAAIFIAEFALFLAIKWHRKQLYVCVSPPKGGKALSLAFHVITYCLMDFVPFLNLRAPWDVGGIAFGGWIVFRIIGNSLVFFAAAQKFDAVQDVGIAAADARLIYFCAIGVLVLGSAIFMFMLRASHRWTLYSGSETGPEHSQWEFAAKTLVNAFETETAQRCWCFMFYHPSYLNKDEVRSWLLGLDVSAEIFQYKEVLPDGIDEFSGTSLDAFFARCLTGYAWYGDDNGLREIEAKVDELKAAIVK
jgi:hypothetical protein